MMEYNYSLHREAQLLLLGKQHPHVETEPRETKRKRVRRRRVRQRERMADEEHEMVPLHGHMHENFDAIHTPPGPHSNARTRRFGASRHQQYTNDSRSNYHHYHQTTPDFGRVAKRYSGCANAMCGSH